MSCGSNSFFTTHTHTHTQRVYVEVQRPVPPVCPAVRMALPAHGTMPATVRRALHATAV